MKKPIIILLFFVLAGCNEMMHDAPSGGCGTVADPLEKKFQASNVFKMNCATCHHPLKDATGPALKGAIARWNNDTARLKAFIRNSAKVIKKDKYAKTLHDEWKGEMTAFPNLTDKELNELIGMMK